MSTALTSLRGLYWKETRQIVPLIGILIGVAFLLMTIWPAFSSTSRTFAFSGLYIPLILPALYAAGAGALLVGQEKEQKTLWWLASLPARPSSLIMVKFFVALAGLVVMWLCSWLLTLLSGFMGAMPVGASLPPRMQFNYGALHLHSVFILVCGFYSAWRLKNAFASLVAIIPLASIPLVVTQFGYAIRNQLTGHRIIDSETSAVATSWVTVVAIVIIGWLAYRAARKNLHPAEPQRLTPNGQSNWLDAWRPTTAGSTPREPYRFSISSLVWQSIHHNRAGLAGIFAMLSFGMVCLALSSYSEFLNRFGSALIAGTLVGTLGVSWLGVFVFTGDGSSERIRFLAERGISPAQAWLGRQLIGISLLSIALLLFAALSLWLLHVMTEPYAVVPSVALVTIVGGIAYSVSQWTSQLLRILAASAFVAPLLSGVTVYWFAFAAAELDTPLWVLLLSAALPMIATWLLMHRYMDGHRGLVTWLTALATVMLVIFLPVVPLAIDVARAPQTPASVRAELIAAAKEVRRSSVEPQRITLARMSDGRETSEMSGAQVLQFLEQQSFRPSDRLVIPFEAEDTSTPATVDFYVVEEAIALATYEKLKFESSPEDEAAIESIGRWVAALTETAVHLRQSHQWWDQGIADLIEIWLTQTLSSDSFEALLDRDFARAAIDLVADKQGRNQVRRRAVLASANSSYVKSLYRTYFTSETMPKIKRSLIEDQVKTALMVATLRLIDAGAAGKPTEAVRREIHALMIGPSIEFSDGPYADRMRVGADGVLEIQSRPAMYPCRHWYAPWETDAARLAETRKLDPQHQQNVDRDQTRESP